MLAIPLIAITLLTVFVFIIHGCPARTRVFYVLAGLPLTIGMLAARWYYFERTTLAAVQFTETLRAKLPRLERDDEYVSSSRCQSCHPQEHASWHRTYHRTMTQVALPKNVRGSFDGSTVTAAGLNYRVFRKGDEFWAEMPDPDEMMYVVQGGKPRPIDQIPLVERRVVMTTGSHHYQTYWVPSEKYPTVLQTLPLVYLINDHRWIPREAAFLHPPGTERMITQWNHHCIKCHSTGGVPGLDVKTGNLMTRVGELGISCEACHGPGQKHIEANQDPRSRYLRHVNGKGDPTIVNPARLAHDAASQVCGQCHGVYIERDQFAMRYPTEGILYRPGQDLHRTRNYIQHPINDNRPQRWDELSRNRQFFRDRWWDDGTVLAGGREYTALMASGCYLNGPKSQRISCLSCHSMHESDPNDQLAAGGSSNLACTQCHTGPQFAAQITQHTHHSADSVGSNCMNCHMPYTTYALLGAIRNHQIVSPRIATSIQHGTPNACNLCHLDRTLAWAQDHTSSWYGHAKLDLTDDQRSVAAAVSWMLKGHAAQRAITAWHFGWEPAIATSGNDWYPPLLVQLLADPYGVVRYIAEHALRKHPDYRELAFDFLASAGTQKEFIERLTQSWQSQHQGQLRSVLGAEVLQSSSSLDLQRLRDLLRQRDDRPVDIKE